MAAQNQQQKFFEIIKPGSTYEFIGNQKYWIGLSIVLVLLTIVMLPLNAYVFKSRGHMLNWGVDFRGGSEILIEFSKPVEAGEIRKALADIRPRRRRRGEVRGPHRQEAVELHDPRRRGLGGLRAAGQADPRVARQGGRRHLKHFEWSEGGDKIYLRYDKAGRSGVAGELAQGASASTPTRCRASAAPRRTPTR